MGKVLLFGEAMGLFIAQEQGELEEIVNFKKSVAGAELNVAIGLKRLEHDVIYISKVGEDFLGSYIKKYMQKENIDTSYIKIDKYKKTGLMFKSKVENGDPKIDYYRKDSAFSNLELNDLDNINFKEIDILHLTGIPIAISKRCREIANYLINKAKENNIYITFDTNLRLNLWENRETMIQVINDIAKECDLILPGINEGKILTGYDSVEKIANFYEKLGVKEIIIKDGKNGAYIKTKNNSFYEKGFYVEKVIDTVGAGDGFAAGIISGKLEKLNERDCLIRANAIGAMQVQVVSDNEGLPNKDELNKFISENYKI